MWREPATPSVPNELLALGRASPRRSAPIFCQTTRQGVVWQQHCYQDVRIVPGLLALGVAGPAKLRETKVLRREGDAAYDIGQVCRPWCARGGCRSLHAETAGAAACCHSGNAAVASGTGLHLPLIGAVRMPWTGLACCIDTGQHA